MGLTLEWWTRAAGPLEDRKLHVDEKEAAIVREIFSLYLELGSVCALQRELRRRDVRSRVRLTPQPASRQPSQGPLTQNI